MRVAIVGGPGIGKSTLVRQLGDLYHNGSYGEGEKGVWDPRVLEDIALGRNAVGVTAYFGALYDANYRDAVENDQPGKVIFFEGARITLEAHIAEYPVEHHAALRKTLAIGDAWKPDRTIVLTSSTATIEKHIKLRNRPYEIAENMVRRFRLIDDEFRRLAPHYPNTIVVDRDGKEFHERGGLMDIIAAANLPMFPGNSIRSGPQNLTRDRNVSTQSTTSSTAAWQTIAQKKRLPKKHRRPAVRRVPPIAATLMDGDGIDHAVGDSHSRCHDVADTE